MKYEYHQRQCAFYGFTHCEITETGFLELTKLGFNLDNLYEIECDLQCGFTLSESINAMKERESAQ